MLVPRSHPRNSDLIVKVGSRTSDALELLHMVLVHSCVQAMGTTTKDLFLKE